MLIMKAHMHEHINATCTDTKAHTNIHKHTDTKAHNHTYTNTDMNNTSKQVIIQRLE